MNEDCLEGLEVMSWEVCPLGLIVLGLPYPSPLPEHPPFAVLVLHDRAFLLLVPALQYRLRRQAKGG